MNTNAVVFSLKALCFNGDFATLLERNYERPDAVAIATVTQFLVYYVTLGLPGMILIMDGNKYIGLVSMIVGGITMRLFDSWMAEFSKRTIREELDELKKNLNTKASRDELHETRDALGNRISETHDALGNRISETRDALGNRISETRDALDAKIETKVSRDEVLIQIEKNRTPVYDDRARLALFDRYQELDSPVA